jgi:hypothetical protein
VNLTDEVVISNLSNVRDSVAGPDPGSGAFLTPVSGIEDEQPRSYFLELRNHIFWVKILKFFDADPGSGMEKSRIRDPGETSWIRNTG